MKIKVLAGVIAVVLSAAFQDGQTLLQEKQEELLRIEEERKEKQEKLIVIDAGHQKTQNTELEPVGPGSSEMKSKVSSGTAGTVTGTPEYQVTLDVSLKLQAILEERGYSVRMVRTANEVDISNSERAALANDNQADVFVRIHCDGSEDPSARGAMTICMTPASPYCADIYEDSRRLSEEVLDHMCEKAGVQKNRIWETDTMSGINWCQVPVTIVEMGYLTNPEEEQKLINADHQALLAEGIADGIEAYLSAGTP